MVSDLVSASAASLNPSDALARFPGLTYSSMSLCDWQGPPIMQKALNRHDSTLRTLTGRYFGYEVTTEGDR